MLSEYLVHRILFDDLLYEGAHHLLLKMAFVLLRVHFVNIHIGLVSSLRHSRFNFLFHARFEEMVDSVFIDVRKRFLDETLLVSFLVGFQNSMKYQLLEGLSPDGRFEAKFHSDFHQGVSPHDLQKHVFGLQASRYHPSLFELVNRVGGSIECIKFESQEHHEGAHLLLVPDDKIYVSAFLMKCDTLPCIKWQLIEILVILNQLIDTNLEHPKSGGEAAVGKSIEVRHLDPLSVILEGDALFAFLAFDIE